MNFALEKSQFFRSQYHYYDALYIGRSSATIKGCIFSFIDYTALHVDNSSLSIDYSIFRGNRILHGGSITIHNEYHKNVTISNSGFYSNYGAISAFTSYLVIHNTTFYGNIIGGALAVQNTRCIVNISQCSFAGNDASIGGSIFVSSSSTSLSIQQSVFIGNIARGGNGGAIYVNGSNNSVSIYRSAMETNSASISGGAIFLTGNNSRILIEKSSLTGNEAFRQSGGAIRARGLNIYISITESTLSNNWAAKCVTLDVNDGQHFNVILKDSIFKRNLADTESGGVACVRNATISILNSNFSLNRAAENAGVFAVDDSNMTIHGSTFDSNIAGANGGAVNTEYFRNSLLVSRTSFTNNQAAKQGGVMYLGRKGTQVKISRSVIGFNNALRGGFATVLGSSLEIATSNILNNTAEVGEVISECNSDISVSDQLFSSTDPVYAVCTLYSGNSNDPADLEVTATSEPSVYTTTTDNPAATNRHTPETITMRATTSLTTEPSIMASVHFELNGKVYLNNSAVSLFEVGENENALVCKTDLMPCCESPPKFYYPNGDTVLVKKAGDGFYRQRGAQEVHLNRRDGVTSPTGPFRCTIPDASGTVRNLFIHILGDAVNDEQKY